ncbi:MAG: hypothetical protein NTX03_03795 [Bacteroidetes bacterium]|nr:hypothetical protein [Bacteroidota bacterium]
MIQTTINPYAGYSTLWQTGINACGGAPANVLTMNNNLETATAGSYIAVGTTTSDVLALSAPGLKDIIANSQNGFVNSDLKSINAFSGVQSDFVDYLLNGIKNIPIESIPDLISDTEDNISKSGLSSEEQCPLLLATMVGAAAYTFWQPLSLAPGGSFPAPPLSPPPTNFINWENVAYWVASAMEGALLGYINSKAIYPNAPTGNLIAAMVIASAGVNGGVVNFKWIPRIQNK